MVARGNCFRWGLLFSSTFRFRLSLKTISAMNSSQSMHTRMFQQFDLTTQSGRIASMRAAIQALDSERAMQKQPFAYPLEKEQVASAASAVPPNFKVQVGIEAAKHVLLSGIRAAITSLDDNFAVMCFPKQHGPFLWEVALPRGNYKLEITGTNVDGSLTTADIQGMFSRSPAQTHSASNDSEYTLILDFTIE